MKNQPKNITTLYSYFVNNGFSHSMEDIASGIHVTKKTLHNRYITRQYMEDQVMFYWRSQFLNRFEEKVQFSNHSVESLLLLIFEMELSLINEFPFFERESFLCQDLSKLETHFLTNTIIQIIKKGQQNGDFSYDLDLKKYSTFLIFNIMNYFFKEVFRQINGSELRFKKDRVSIVNQYIDADLIEYLISPILTLKGKVRFKEIDLNILFIVH